MSPILSTSHLLDRADVDAVSAGDNIRFFCAFNYLFYLAFGKLGSSATRTNSGKMTKDTIAVSYVGRFRYVFEVFEAWICLVPVLVVHLKAFWAWADKGRGNHPVDQAHFMLFVFPCQRKRGIASRIEACRYSQPSGVCSFSGSNSLDATDVGNFVPSLKPDDGFPDFNGSINFRHVGPPHDSMCLGPHERGNAFAA